MKIQIPNKMSIDDHVIKINLAKNRVKNSIFEMADAITNALNQLENRQVELAQKLGMSKGTLSKWYSIGSNNNIMEIRELAPPSFDSLYQLRVLDNQYHKYYGEEEGGKKFVKLFKNKIVTPSSQRNDINKIIKLGVQDPQAVGRGGWRRGGRRGGRGRFREGSADRLTPHPPLRGVGAAKKNR